MTPSIGPDDADFGWYTALDEDRHGIDPVCEECLPFIEAERLYGVSHYSRDSQAYEAIFCSHCGTLILPPLCPVCTGPCECLNYQQLEDAGAGEWQLCTCGHWPPTEVC